MPIEQGYTGGMSKPKKTTSFSGGGGSFAKPTSKTVSRPVAKPASRTTTRSKVPLRIAPKAAPAPKKKVAQPFVQRAQSSGAYRPSSGGSSPQSFNGGGGSFGGGGFSGGGGSFGGGGGVSSASAGGLGTSSVGTLSSFAAPMEPPAPLPWDQMDKSAQEDYLSGDATFVAQRAALLQQLADQESALNRDVDDYGLDTEKTMRNLGLRGGRFMADKDVFEGGEWNPDDRIGAYGMSFGNQENDFGARGMLDSSGYDRAFGDLNTSFNRQKGDIIDALGTFVRNANQRKTEARNTNQADVTRARADAIARRAANLGLAI